VMDSSGDRPTAAAPTPETKKPLVAFNGVISLGNLLIVAGMVSTGIAGIYTVGGQVQQLRDAQTHETEMRVMGEQTITAQLTTNATSASRDVANLSAQEARDVSAIGVALQEIKSDFRSLVQASTPQPEPRRR
jgi:hypothetical protein